MLSKILGAFYRIPLTNILGAEGMGIYQMVFPLYAMLLTLSSGGLPVAISYVVSQYMANNNSQGAKRVLRVSLVLLVIVGIVGSAGVIALHNILAIAQGNYMASLAYLGVAPAIVFVAAISSYRGYFQGIQNMLPSSISNLVEQVVKLTVGLSLAVWLLPYGIQYAVLGAMIGVSISELAALVILLLSYKIIAGNVNKAKNRTQDNGYMPDCSSQYHSRIDKNELSGLSIETNSTELNDEQSEHVLFAEDAGRVNSSVVDCGHYQQVDVESEGQANSAEPGGGQFQQMLSVENGDRVNNSVVDSDSQRMLSACVAQENSDVQELTNEKQLSTASLIQSESKHNSVATERRSDNSAVAYGGQSKRYNTSILHADNHNKDRDTEVALDIDMTQLASTHSFKKNNIKDDGWWNIIKSIYSVAMPVTIGAMILPLTQLLDSIITINFLIGTGSTRADATSYYGLLNGPVGSLVNMPIVLTMAIAVALLPRISHLTSSQQLHKTVSDSMRYALIVALPTAAGLVLYSRPILQLLYSGGLDNAQIVMASKMLRISAMIVVYASIIQISTATLQGLGYPKRPPIILGIGAIFKLASTLILMYLVGIYGLAIATVVFYLVAAVLSIKLIKKHVQCHSTFLLSVVMSMTVGMGGGYVFYVFVAHISGIVALVTAGLISIVLYVLLCFITNAIKMEDFKGRNKPN